MNQRYSNTKANKKRWWWPAGILIILMGMILLDYANLEHGEMKPGALLEVLFFSVAIPILFIYIYILSRKIERQYMTIGCLSQLQNFENKIAQIQDWEQLILTIVSFPGTIVPVSGVALLLNQADQGGLTVVAHYGAYPDGLPDKITYLPHNLNPICRGKGANVEPSSCDCLRQNYSSHLKLGVSQYCLPLWQSDNLVGMLHLYLPVGETIDPDQARFLASLVPTIVMAINNLGPLNTDIKLSLLLEDEWRQIARYIHDTLGHNLAYLRLKLDQLTYYSNLQDTDSLKDELISMNDTANLTYWQMRMALADLNMKNPPDLADTLANNLQVIEAHTKLETRFRVYGEPKRLSNFIRRRVLFIVSEVLSNLEQHSSASRIEVELAWEEDQVRITITDDGPGFSFNEQASKPGHFGLRIIKECTNEINGYLEHESIPEVGNRVVLCFPIFSIEDSSSEQRLLFSATEVASPLFRKVTSLK